MKSYSEVADIVSKVQQIGKIMKLLQKGLEDIISVKQKCELWIEDKENLSYSEIAQFIICETSKVLHKNISIAGIKIENLASEQTDKEDEDQSVEFELTTSPSHENQNLMEKYGTLSSDAALQSKEIRKIGQKFKEQLRKYKELQDDSEKTQIAVQDVDKRFTEFKEEVMNELHDASIFMSQLQTQCQTLSAEIKEIKDTHNKSREALSVQIVELKENFTETTANLLQKQDDFEAEQEHLKSILSEKKLSEVDLDLKKKDTETELLESNEEPDLKKKDTETELLESNEEPEFLCKRTCYVMCDPACLHVIGHHEQQISVDGETSLRKYLKECKKNPGHANFISVNSFSLEHLPHGYRNKDVYELVKAAANLTVRISVTMVSLDRPELWPNTNIPYFLYNMRGSQNLRTGSGMINSVLKETRGRCLCDKCENSNKPNQEWWRITVRTDECLICDDIEASHTTIRLFYDTEDSPDIVLKHVNTSCLKNANEKHLIICVTCDKKLANKLLGVVEHYEYLNMKVNQTYTHITDIDKFMFLVSHPHGSCKKISIGQWEEKYTEGLIKVFTYLTPTCSGSSGATVHCVGYESQIHEGCLKSGLNYSKSSCVIF